MTSRIPGLAALRIAIVAVVASMAGAGAAGAAEFGFVLDGKNLRHFFPNAEDPDLPDYYKKQKDFPRTLADSIRKFVGDSLDREHIDAQLGVMVIDDTALMTLRADDPEPLMKAFGFASMLRKFTNAGHADLGYLGARGCQAAQGCWDPAPGKSPWAFYLPLGLPLVNQKAVMLLNYPPSDALCATDYLNNFTMARWETVLRRVGIKDPPLYETIVDIHPIAAPGSGQSACIAKTSSYFYSTTKPSYDSAMTLDLVLDPPFRHEATAVPLQVAGSDALTTWAQMIDRASVKPGEVGTFPRPGKPSVPWVATNHPDVTTYQHCKGDPGKGEVKSTGPSANVCTVPGPTPVYVDDALVQDELMDLQAACVLKTLAEHPATIPEKALDDCKKIWCVEKDGKCKRRDVCIQARMDYDPYYGPKETTGNCACEKAAEAFCDKYDNNACPSETSVTSCVEFNSMCKNPPAYKKCATPS